MPRKISSRSCPWWTKKYGLSQFIRSTTKQESKLLDLSELPVQTVDLSLVNSAGRYIVQLNFHGCHQLTDDAIKYLSETWHLRGLNCSYEKSIQEHAHLNHHLLHLDLSFCEQLTDRSCKYISSFAKRLLSLNLNNCTLIGDRGLKNLMEGLKYLEEIEVSNLYRLQDESMPFIIRNLVLMKRLRTMDLSGTSFSNEAFISLFESDPDPGVLRNVNVSRTKIELGLIGLKRKNVETKVKVITMNQLPNILDSMLEWIALGCKDLQSLDISEAGCVSDYAINSLLKGCRSLKVLNVRGCNTLSDEAFKGLGSLEECSLRVINLSHCSKLTSACLVAIASSCSDIYRINLQGLSKVCDIGLVPLACKCPLQEVDLSAASLGNVPRFGSRGLIALGQNCNGLKVLRSNYCSKIEDSSIIAIANGCPRLETIFVKRCYKLSDRSLLAIGKNCHYLRRIDISSCREITDYGIKNLVNGCKLLVNVDFSNLGITDSSVDELGSCCSSLSTISLQNCYKITDASISKLMYRHNIRSGIFIGCSVNEKSLLQTTSLFSKLSPGTFVFSPLLSDTSVHKRHRLYISFLQLQVNIITCAIRGYILAKRCRKLREVKELASKKIQSADRSYSIELRQRENLEYLRIARSINLITAQFLGSAARSSYIKKRKAVKVIQRIARLYNAKLRFQEIKTQLIKPSDDKPRREVSIEVLALWRLWTVKVILFKTVTKGFLIRRVQNTWRTRRQYRLIRQLRWKALFQRWIHSVLSQKRFERQTRFKGAFVIQTSWRQRQDWIRLIYRLRANHRDGIERKLAMNRVTIALQSRWRSALCQRLLNEMKLGALSKGTAWEAATKLQCWYRMQKTKKAMHVLQKLVACWERLAIAAMHRQKTKEMLAVHSRYIQDREEDRIKNAALILTTRFSALFRKRQQTNLLRVRSQLNAALCIQSWWRVKAQRLGFLRVAASVKSIQRTWKGKKYRQKILELYKEEKSRRHAWEARAKNNIIKLRVERKILELFKSSRENAAVVIQRAYCAYRRMKHAREEEMHSLNTEELRSAKKLERLDEIIRYKQEQRKFKVSTYMGKVSKGFRDATSLRLIHNIRANRRESMEQGQLGPSLVGYYMLQASRTGTTSMPSDSNVDDFKKDLCKTFANTNWWNKECLELSLRYLMWPKDFHALRRIWIESLDFKREEHITIMDFFDHVQESRSEYAPWLFPNLDVDQIPFPGYITAISRAALLNKADILQLVFDSVTRDSMCKDDWERLLEILLSNEPIQYPKRMAIAAFHQFNSKDVHKNDVLYFEDFKKITAHYPFAIQPFVRLISSIRKHHLGEQFWRAKRAEIERAYEIANKSISE